MLINVINFINIVISVWVFVKKMELGQTPRIYSNLNIINTQL